LVDKELLVIQYIDDIVIFMNNNLESAKNIKFLLYAFEQLSGLKINFHKGKLFCYGATKANQVDYVQIFRCDLGSFPFRYLGIFCITESS
jgi:hypothetical protein